MPIFLRPDQLPFWLIVLTSAIIWWLRDLWPRLFKRVNDLIQQKLGKSEEDESLEIENLYRQELFQFAQENHIASALFPLSDITIPPKLQVPTPDYDTETPASNLPLTNEIIPYLPEMPELAAFYDSPTIGIRKAIETGFNIGLIGRSGSGKTHTLSWLAVELAQKKPKLGSISELLPIYIHATDLDPEITDVTLALSKIWEENNSNFKARELERFFEKYLLERNVILLVDGLDEVHGERSDEFIKFISELRNQYPGNKLIVSLSPCDLSAMEPLNLYPLSLAYWNEKDLKEFSVQWHSAWQKASRSEIGMKAIADQTPEFIFQRLILDQGKVYSPFEITLKLWGLYSTDIPDGNICNDLDTYLKIQTHNLKDSPGILEAIAAKLHQQKRSSLEIDAFEKSEKNLIPAFINRGILIKRGKGQIGFAHQNIYSYLAAKKIKPIEALKNLKQKITWETNSLVLQYSPKSNGDSKFIDQCFRLNKSDPLRTFTLKASRWFRVSSKKDAWLKRLHNLLAIEIQNKELPYSMKVRIISELALANIKKARPLFRKLIDSDDPFDIILGLIGAGINGDYGYTDQIGELLFHELPFINQTASLVLIKFSTNESMEKLGQGFLHASDTAKIIIAEALAHNEAEGHQILRDGTEVINQAVRRAAVFGLARIKDDWAHQFIKELSQEDEQWLVRNAAADALSLSSLETWKYPKAIVKLNKSSWLLNFAAEHGVGVGPGQAAWKMVESAISRGNKQQKLYALTIFNKAPYKAYNLSSELVDLLNEPDLTIRERAYNLLLFLQAIGVSVKN